MRLGIALSIAGCSRAVAIPATWNPADKSAAITLSNGNLTASGDGLANNMARGTLSRASGKRYFEATGPSLDGDSTGIGFANASANLASYSGSDTNSVGYYGSGTAYHNAAGTLLTAYGPADRVGAAIDIGAGIVWFSRNGVWFGDPVAGTGGIAVAGIGATVFPSFSSANPDSMTANFGATAFTHAPPSGFLAWAA